MKTFLLDTGYDLLTAQSNSTIASVVLTGFKLGSGVGEVFDRENTEPEGDVLFTGGVEYITYTPISDDEILIICRVEKDFDVIEPGNIVIYGNDGDAFCASISEHGLLKHTTTDNIVGTTFTFQLLLHIPQLMSRFDFSNLEVRTATMKTFDTDDDVTRWPWEEPHDQLIIELDGRTNRPAMILTVNRQYWGFPFLRDFSDNDDMIGINNE